MKIVISDAGVCVKSVKVEIAPETVTTTREEVLRQLQRVVRVPGFRVGHAPRALVVQHYAAKTREETIRRVIGDQLPKALQEAKLDLLGDPEVTEVSLDDGRPMIVTARCEIMPAIKVRTIKGLKVKRPAVRVTDAQVQTVLVQLQERHAELVPVEPRAVAVGDYAIVDFTCTVEGKAIEQRAGVAVCVKPDEDTSGISRHLVGAVPGPAPSTFETTLPKDLPAKAYADKPATFSVTLKEVKVKQVPPLDEAFAKLVGVETLEALRARIRQDLEQELTAQARRAAEEQVIDALLKQAAFEVPASLIQSQAERLLRDAQLKLIYQGVAPAEVEGRRQLLADQSKQEALRQVKVFFLLRQVAKEQSLIPTEQEVAQRIEAMAARAGRPVEAVRAELQQQRLVGDVTWELTRTKVLDALLAQANIEEEVTS